MNFNITLCFGNRIAISIDRTRVFFQEIEKGNVLTVSATAAHTAIKIITCKCGTL